MPVPPKSLNWLLMRHARTSCTHSAVRSPAASASPFHPRLSPPPAPPHRRPAGPPCCRQAARRVTLGTFPANSRARTFPAQHGLMMVAQLPSNPGDTMRPGGRIVVEIGEVYVLSAWVTVSSEPPSVEAAPLAHKQGLLRLCTFGAVL